MSRYNPYEDQFAKPQTFITKGASVVQAEEQRRRRGLGDRKARQFEEIANDTETFGNQMPTMGSSIGNKVRSLRSQNEWTQKELAMKMSVKVDVIRDIENGSARMDTKLIRKLETIFGESIRD